jgi:hypothetical protein
METSAGDNKCRVWFENLIHLINQTKLAGESEGAQAEAPLQFPIGMLGECAQDADFTQILCQKFRAGIFANFDQTSISSSYCPISRICYANIFLFYLNFWKNFC